MRSEEPNPMDKLYFWLNDCLEVWKLMASAEAETLVIRCIEKDDISPVDNYKFHGTSAVDMKSIVIKYVIIRY